MNDETGPFDQPKNCASITMRQIFLKDYIMHRTPLILIALIGMLCCLAHEANADSRQGHGIILTVKDDDEDWPPTINAQGIFASDFSDQRFLPWTFRLTYRFNGRDFRLTDVFGNVIHDVLA